mmetsp:Transcript_22102/g.45770  ORF Transcript_22102/g.45770 Transcript_22102/m.45770 type:complete len:222 (-) Transcript_22102:52-717(-)
MMLEIIEIITTVVAGKILMVEREESETKEALPNPTMLDTIVEITFEVSMERGGINLLRRPNSNLITRIRKEDHTMIDLHMEAIDTMIGIGTTMELLILPNLLNIDPMIEITNKKKWTAPEGKDLGAEGHFMAMVEITTITIAMMAAITILDAIMTTTVMPEGGIIAIGTEEKDPASREIFHQMILFPIATLLVRGMLMLLIPMICQEIEHTVRTLPSKAVA